ncbi:MAG: leucine-rich repeat domain-containing protein [Oscillospiraceae bacterium]|nr:leucine-rich repeat domain-containing protein [Oscillospiraceae bacterium]
MSKQILSKSLAWALTFTLMLSMIPGLAMAWGDETTIAEIFPDPNLADAVASALSKDVADFVTKQELDSIRTLETKAVGKNIEDITGVENLSGIRELRLDDNMITDLTPLAGLSELRWLHLSDNQISNIDSVAGLSELRWLLLGYNTVSDLTPIAGLLNLNQLWMGNNQISDITPVAGLTDLEYLSLGNNRVADISAVSGLSKLKYLWLDENNISSIGALSALTALETLALRKNQIADITPLAALNKLHELHLSDQSITLDYVTIDTATEFAAKNIAGTNLPLSLQNSGSYENNMLSWTETGTNLASWGTQVSIGGTNATFSGTLSQKTRDPFTVKDILAIRDHILGKTPLPAIERTMMDVNKDGIINIFDMLVMRDGILRRRINAELRMQNAEL